MEIELLEGDISEIEADAVVNAAETSLYMGGGVAGSLRKKGGKEIELEAVEKSPVKLGEAVVTGAHRLKARYVIHAAAMPHYGDRKATPESIEMAVANSLEKADKLGCKSIAFPAVGCGIAGFPMKKGAEIIIEVMKGFKARSLRTCFIVLYSREDYCVFREALAGWMWSP